MGKSGHGNIDEPTKHESQHLAGAQSNHCEDQQRCVALVQRNCTHCRVWRCVLWMSLAWKGRLCTLQGVEVCTVDELSLERETVHTAGCGGVYCV